MWVLQGHKLRSVTVELAARRNTNRKDSAVGQTTDIVASHTGDKWTENAVGLYPYLKRSKVNKGQDSIHTDVQLPAPDSDNSRGIEMTSSASANRHAKNSVQPNEASGVTLV